MLLRAVGVVRSPVRERKSMPPLGVPARLDLFPQYEPGLLRIEKHSHVWVLAWLDGAERDVLQVTPKGVADRGPEGLHGVFAVRSPVRPNPIGLTGTRVTRVEKGALEVERLDFLDNTPVVDIKPYFTSRDLVFSAANAQIGQPASREALRQSLLVQAVNFHGELCAGLALGIRLVEHFRAEVLQMMEPASWKVTAPLARPCLVDALMGMSRATPGRRNLLFHGEDAVEFECAGVRRRYALTAAESDPGAVLAAADATLFG